jgi:TolA-binding protein
LEGRYATGFLGMSSLYDGGLVATILALGAAVGGLGMRMYGARAGKQSTILSATTSAAEALSAAAAALVTPLQDQLAQARERIRVLEERDQVNKERIRTLEDRGLQYERELGVLRGRLEADI